MPIKYKKQLEEAEKRVQEAETEEEKKDALISLEALRVYVDAMVYNKKEMEYLA